MYDDSSISEDSAAYALFKINGFNLFKAHFKNISADDAGFHYHAEIGNSVFIASAVKPGVCEAYGNGNEGDKHSGPGTEIAIRYKQRADYDYGKCGKDERQI